MAVKFGEEGVSCSVETGPALAVAGPHPATGGDGTLVCSGDKLLQALVACAGVTRAVTMPRFGPVAETMIRHLPPRSLPPLTSTSPPGMSPVPGSHPRRGCRLCPGPW